MFGCPIRTEGGHEILAWTEAPGTTRNGVFSSLWTATTARLDGPKRSRGPWRFPLALRKAPFALYNRAETT